MAQVFVSHTKEDKDFCDAFDRVCARVGIKAFRSEFEEISAPAWKTIQDAMNNSVALFFLVGKELVKNVDLFLRSDLPKNQDIITSWIHTQNWIAFEIGLACQKGIDVWAICDGVLINFPMPYINNYLTMSITDRSAFNFLKDILEDYKNGFTYPILEDRAVVCPHMDCKVEFNLHVQVPSGGKIRCPRCLRDMEFTKGNY